MVGHTKSTFVQYLSERLTSLAFMNEEPAWAQWGKTFLGKKQSLNWVLVMWHVWLVWILTTKHKPLKRVENFERYVIFSCYYSWILLFKRFLCCCVHLWFRFILQTVLLSRNLSFSICSTLNPDYSFVFECCNLPSIWNNAQIFVFAGSVSLFPYSSYYWRHVLSRKRSKDWKTKSGASPVSRSRTLEGTLCL